MFTADLLFCFGEQCQALFEVRNRELPPRRVLKILDRAGLIERSVEGREHHCRLHPRALKEAEDWLNYHRKFWETRLDELVARASEVRIGTVDTANYQRDVDDLVIQLEALHQAVEETRTA